MSRSLGQVVVSVVATLIATVLTSGLLEAWRGPGSPPAVRPVIGIVDWSVTPLHPVQLVTDPGWTGPDLLDGPPVPRPPAPTRKPSRHTLRQSLVGPAPVAAAIAPLTLHTAADPPPEPGVMARATADARTLITSGGSVLVSGGTGLLRWLSWSR